MLMYFDISSATCPTSSWSSAYLEGKGNWNIAHDQNVQPITQLSPVLPCQEPMWQLPFWDWTEIPLSFLLWKTRKH